MKKLVIVISAVIIAMLSMTACGNTEEEFTDYEIRWAFANATCENKEELRETMIDYTKENKVYVNDYFINEVKEGSNVDYYLMNKDGKIVKLVKAKNSNSVYLVNVGGIN